MEHDVLLYSYSLYPISEVTSSQPVHFHGNDESGEGIDGADTGHVVSIESFTQPSRFDELIVGTQIPCTPGASQVNRLPSIYCIGR